MSGFLVFHSTVKDPERFQEYAQAVGPTLEPFGGRVTVRGKAREVLAGTHTHEAVGVLQFPDYAHAQGWYRSEAYQNLVPNRDLAADMTVIGFEAPQ